MHAESAGRKQKSVPPITSLVSFSDFWNSDRVHLLQRRRGVVIVERKTLTRHKSWRQLSFAKTSVQYVQSETARELEKASIMANRNGFIKGCDSQYTFFLKIYQNFSS